MAKETQKAKIDRLETELAAKEQALSAARNGLFRIIDTDPIRFKGAPGSPPGIIKAFEYVQETADKTVLAISDAEQAS